jgi:hypothetical protein
MGEDVEARRYIDIRFTNSQSRKVTVFSALMPSSCSISDETRFIDLYYSGSSITATNLNI